MSHNFVEQASGTWGCSQCGETRADLIDPARFVDGVPPRCLFAPTGNKLSHPVYFIIPPHMYLSIPLLFNKTNTMASIIYLVSDSFSHCHRCSRYVILFVCFLYTVTKPLFNVCNTPLVGNLLSLTCSITEFARSVLFTLEKAWRNAVNVTRAQVFYHVLVLLCVCARAAESAAERLHFVFSSASLPFFERARRR
jgi:hypothetical protein